MTVINDEVEFVAEDDAGSLDGKPSLASLVEHGVNIKREQSILKEDLSDIAKTAKDFYNISKRDFNKLVKYSFEASITEDIEDLQAIQNKLQNLVDQPQRDLFDEGEDE